MHPRTTNAVGHLRLSEDYRYPTAERCRIRAEDIRRYARMIGEDHPEYTSPEAAAALGYTGPAAPPTFASMLWLRAERRILPSLLGGTGPVRLLHTEQTLRIGRLLVAGDVIATDVYLESVEQCGDYEKFCVTTVLTDHSGVVVQVGTSTLLSCGARLSDRVGTSPALESARARLYATPHPPRDRPGLLGIDRFARGDELPRSIIRPHHGEITGFHRLVNGGLGNDGPANEALPHGTPAAPSLLRFGWLARYLGTRFGHPEAVTCYRAEFSHYCVPGQAIPADVEFRGRITEVDRSSGTAETAVTATSAGRRIFVRAGASVSMIK